MGRAVKLIPIDEHTKKHHASTTKLVGERHSWWYVKELPTLAIQARATGHGTVKEGSLVYLIAGHNRNIFPGKSCEKFTVHEFVGLVANTGWQPLVQLGRDVKMVE